MKVLHCKGPENISRVQELGQRKILPEVGFAGERRIVTGAQKCSRGPALPLPVL